MATRIAPLDGVELTEHVIHLARYAAKRAEQSTLGAASFHRSYTIGSYRFDVRGGGDYTTVFVSSVPAHSVKHPSGLVFPYYARDERGYFTSLDSAFEFAVETADTVFSVEQVGAVVPTAYICLADDYPEVPEAPMSAFYSTLESALEAVRNVVFPRAIHLLRRIWRYFGGDDAVADSGPDDGEADYFDAVKRLDIAAFFDMWVAEFVNKEHPIYVPFTRDMSAECLRLFFDRLRSVDKAVFRVYDRSLNRPYGFELVDKLGGTDGNPLVVFPVRGLRSGVSPRKTYFVFEGVPFAFYTYVSDLGAYPAGVSNFYPLGFQNLIMSDRDVSHEVYLEGVDAPDPRPYYFDRAVATGVVGLRYTYFAFLDAEILEYNSESQAYLIDGVVDFGPYIVRVTAQVWTDLLGLFTDPFFHTTRSVVAPVVTVYDGPPDSRSLFPCKGYPEFNTAYVKPIYEVEAFQTVALDTVYHPDETYQSAYVYTPRISTLGRSAVSWLGGYFGYAESSRVQDPFIYRGSIFAIFPMIVDDGRLDDLPRDNQFVNKVAVENIDALTLYYNYRHSCEGAMAPEVVKVFYAGAVTSDIDGNLAISSFSMCKHPAYEDVNTITFYDGLSGTDRVSITHHRKFTLPPLQEDPDRTFTELYMDGDLEHPSIEADGVKVEVYKYAFPFAQKPRSTALTLGRGGSSFTETDADVSWMSGYAFDIFERTRHSGDLGGSNVQLKSGVFDNLTPNGISARAVYPVKPPINESHAYSCDFLVRRGDVLRPRSAVDMRLLYRYQYTFGLYSRCIKKFVFSLSYSQQVSGVSHASSEVLFTVPDSSVEYSTDNMLFTRYEIEYRPVPNPEVVKFKVHETTWGAFTRSGWLPSRVDLIGVGETAEFDVFVGSNVDGKDVPDTGCFKGYSFRFSDNKDVVISGKFIDFLAYQRIRAYYHREFQLFFPRFALPSLVKADESVAKSADMDVQVRDSVLVRGDATGQASYNFSRDITTDATLNSLSGSSYRVKNFLPSYRTLYGAPDNVTYIDGRNWYGSVFSPYYLLTAYREAGYASVGARLMFARKTPDFIVADMVVVVEDVNLLLLMLHKLYDTPLSVDEFKLAELAYFSSSSEEYGDYVQLRTGAELLQHFESGDFVYWHPPYTIAASSLAGIKYTDKVYGVLGLDLQGFFALHSSISYLPSAAGVVMDSLGDLCSKDKFDRGQAREGLPPVTGAAPFEIGEWSPFISCPGEKHISAEANMRTAVFDPECYVTPGGYVETIETSVGVFVFFKSPPFFKRDVLYYSRDCFWDPFGVIK